jgi:chromosome segregation ATPase
MAESERTMCAGPEREEKAWAEKLTAADRKRSLYQDMAAEGLITFDELREKLVVLEETRKSAERALEALQGQRDRIAKLEQDRDALLGFAPRDRVGGAGRFITR